MSIVIREAVSEDSTTICQLVTELAEFEKLSSEMVARPEDFLKTLFGPQPVAYVFIAELSGQPVGMALYFFNYSTFLAKPGLYLEDLFVLPKYRGNGIGLQLLKKLASVAREKGCGRMEWSVLDWNKDAIRFYERIGARPNEGWTVYRMTENVIKEFSEE